MSEDQKLFTWIDVDEKLPETDCLVLACHQWNRWVVIADFHNRGENPFFTEVESLTDPEDFLIFDVPPVPVDPTHWMPIPEPPKRNLP